MEAMELAGQWRREWAGTAEYGKVTEGGVTRQVARAMEVLNASAPGARVRVMRAAYHSTSGPGVPASSYMLHSSRRVISSGFNLLESPSFQHHSPSKPLEISSTPLDHLPDTNGETENYKVTEPDDIDISEPSKWRSASDKSSLRMPSEESSSTENASIIDLDSRFSHKGLNRKNSYDSENSDINSFKRSSSRTSPLLDAPATLSTLKFKSLLNSSNDWNIRRKSYSFEDTSPLNEVILQSNDTLAMESSTDSGICKSSEIVNDFTEEARKGNVGCDTTRETMYTSAKSSGELNKNRFVKSHNFKPLKEHYVVKEEPRENNIALQSRGKVSITVPITIEDDDYNMNNNQIGDERKMKKVGFCKTELHFAAESGKVNIIATDDKPPPTNDFRKRRSAFVPINEKFEKPITLFGEKSDFLEIGKKDEYSMRSFHEALELDENTAATKSILKNRIPKPKPYLLGENMVFGDPDKTNLSDEDVTPTGVSLINKQLQRKRNDTNEPSLYNLCNTEDMSFRDSLRTTNKGPPKVLSSATEKRIQDNHSSLTKKIPHTNWNNTKILQMSPVQKAKTRQLRENELTYFGIDNQQKKDYPTTKSHSSLKSQPKFFTTDDTFESVRLIKQISSSAQNSEAESDDSPDYQNLPIKSNFAPIPTPRTRVKYKNSDERITILKPIVERANESTIASQEPRRSRSKKQEDVLVTVNRSLSEPPKKQSENSLRRQDELRHSGRQDSTLKRYMDQKKTKEKTIFKTDKARTGQTDVVVDKTLPLYANASEDKDSQELNSLENRRKTGKRINTLEKNKEHRTSKCDSDSLKKKQNNTKNSSRSQRTEKLSTPEYSIQQKRSDSTCLKKTHEDDRRDSKNNRYDVKTSRRTNTDENNELQKNDTISKDKSIKEVTKNHHQKLSSKGNNNKAMESTHKKLDPIIIEHAVKSKDLREIDRTGTDRNYHSTGRKTGRRSEYVIKYDDKNGTVSSVSKVRTGHTAAKQKHASKERSKNNNKDLKTKDKHVDVSALRNAAPRSSQTCERKKRTYSKEVQN